MQTAIKIQSVPKLVLSDPENIPVLAIVHTGNFWIYLSSNSRDNKTINMKGDLKDLYDIIAPFPDVRVLEASKVSVKVFLKRPRPLNSWNVEQFVSDLLEGGAKIIS